MLVKNLCIEIRDMLNLTQKQLSELLKVDQSAVSMYEKGERYPRVLIRKRLIKIANDAGINVSISQLQFKEKNKLKEKYNERRR